MADKTDHAYNCGANAAIVGECSCSLSTPTPGDNEVKVNDVNNLSARLREVASDLNVAAVMLNENELREACFDARDKLTAALSALPAAGEPVFYALPGLIENCQAIAGVQSRHRVVLSTEPEDGYTVPLYTTPQPSAAEELRDDPAFNGRVGRLTIDTPDAAVGAQGDGYDAHEYMEERVAKDLKWFREERASRLAAPAAGKGVDDAWRSIVYAALRSIRYNANNGSQDRPPHERLRLIGVEADRAIGCMEASYAAPAATPTDGGEGKS